MKIYKNNNDESFENPWWVPKNMWYESIWSKKYSTRYLKYCVQT